jgi:ribosome-associated toxin RatA of RatAB toxin-antitoxin module
MNTSQPRGRHAVTDRVVAPPKPAVEAHATVAIVPPHEEASETAFTMGGDPPCPPDQPVVEVVPVPDSRIGRARATVLVRAPVERVKAVLLDFPSYPAFLANYQAAHVERTTPEGSTIVHMKIGGLGGMIRRWMRVEISRPKTEGARLSFDAKLLEGDVKAFSARWVLDRVEEGATKLTLESYLDPDLPLPATFIDSGSAAGLKDSILAVKSRAENSPP